MQNTSVDKFLATLKSQIELTCRIHNCKFNKMPEPLWNITLGATFEQEHLDFSKNSPRVKKNAYTL